MPNSSQSSTWSVGTDPRVQPTRWARLWYVVSLRPYGNDLLTRSSRSALMVMSCLMLLVATAEGIAWGYLGSAFTPQHPWLGGIALGLFVFVLMWLFDRSLVTFDFLEQEHAHTLSGQPQIDPSEDTDASLNPFYVREDWLPKYRRMAGLPDQRLNPFYVREDWLHRRTMIKANVTS